MLAPPLESLNNEDSTFSSMRTSLLGKQRSHSIEWGNPPRPRFVQMVCLGLGLGVGVAVSQINLFGPHAGFIDDGFYYTVTDQQLGILDFDAATGNPLKGLVANPDSSAKNREASTIDSSLDFWAIGLDEVMVGDPVILGRKAFDWHAVEKRIISSTTHGRHSILSFHVHWPGKALRLPRHIKPSDLDLHKYTDLDGGESPHYGNELLLEAFEQFVAELGRTYNNDSRLGFVHLGLLGFWGEWHTYPLVGLVPDVAKQRVTDAFLAAFPDTKLQGRYAGDFADNSRIGLYDGSFAFNTLDGKWNGGVENKEWYFWPVVEKFGRRDFWRTAPMGGETRPELQPIIFEASYAAGTFEHQDFLETVKKTHASYILHNDAFGNSEYSGLALSRALDAHNRMGYAFVVSDVSSFVARGSHVAEVSATIQQAGVAPFYYPLHVVLKCGSIETVAVGVESIIGYGDGATFTFSNVPASRRCFQSMSLHLTSPMELPGRPIKFAQGDGTIEFNIPLPKWTIASALRQLVGQSA